MALVQLAIWSKNAIHTELRDVIYFPQTTVVSRVVDFTIHAGEHPKVDKDQKYLFFGLNVLNSGVTVRKSTFADIPVGIRTNKK